MIPLSQLRKALLRPTSTNNPKEPASDPLVAPFTIYGMNVHPITAPASPPLASPLFDAAFVSLESVTTSFAASLVPTLETTTVTEVALGYHRNQQYSITAMTTSSGEVAERNAYTRYGQPTILNASGSVLTSSAVGNRYTYTGREWDETLGLHHFRARWMSPLAGRFLGRDPIGYFDGYSLYNTYMSMSLKDPSGKTCSSGEYWTGCTSNPINEDDIVGMPYYIKKLDPGVGGRTHPDLEVDCPCSECCGKWSFDYINVDLTLYIWIDVDQHGPKDSITGTYGHEQLHVRNVLRRFRPEICNAAIQLANPGPYDSRRECEVACAFLEGYAKTLLSDVIDGEDHEPDDHEPFKKVPYRPLKGVFPDDPWFWVE